jgi:hypothetical protein
MYQNVGLDGFFDDDMKDVRCMMQRELGYLTNHKCARSDAAYKCVTPTAEGWSYMVGYVPHGVYFNIAVDNILMRAVSRSETDVEWF